MNRTTTARPQDGLSTADEAAAYLKVKRRTLEKWVSKYGLPHVKISRTVRFRLGDLEDAIREKFTKNAN